MDFSFTQYKNLWLLKVEGFCIHIGGDGGYACFFLLLLLNFLILFH